MELELLVSVPSQPVLLFTLITELDLVLELSLLLLTMLCLPFFLRVVVAAGMPLPLVRSTTPSPLLLALLCAVP